MNEFLTASSRPIVPVVDDEKVIATTLAVILTHSAFDAHAIFSGQQAVESLDKLKPDLLITDVDMPGMTDIEATIFSFRAKSQPPIYSKPPGRKGMNLKF